MDYQEAKRLLHPDTTKNAIWEIADKQEAIKKINEACVIACEAMDELQQYKQLGTLDEVREAVEKFRQNVGVWIPADNPPKVNEKGASDFILMSFSKYKFPSAGIYIQDSDGSGSYCFVDGITCISEYMIVNAWMPLPEPYRQQDDK